MKQKGLGRGLDAIFGTERPSAILKPMNEMAELAIEDIVPNPQQPRSQFDEEALDELADSIRQLGVIQPITVRGRDAAGKYVIISGERRWRAARRADLKSLPAYIREADDENLHAMALVEKGAAAMVKDSEAVERAMEEALLLVGDRERLNQLSENIEKLAISDSAERIVRELKKIW